VTVTTSPHFSQANGAAERAVRTAKHILKQKDPSLPLLSYRATFIQATCYSPAQLMLGRQIKTHIPTLEEKLLPRWPDIALVKAADSRAKAAYKHHYDRRHSSRLLPLLKPDDSDAVKLDSQKGWTSNAVVLRKYNTPRSYLIRTNDGILRRNRRHLLLQPPSLSQHQFEEEEEMVKRDMAEGKNYQQHDESTTMQTPAAVTTSRGRVVKQPSHLKDFVT